MTGYQNHPQDINQEPTPMPNAGHKSRSVADHTVQLPSAEEGLNVELFRLDTGYIGALPISEPPLPRQPQSTLTLYQRARRAAILTDSAAARRAGLPYQGRPWTMEEESALMAGLDSVKGPYWSKILEMYGPGGSVSEALKSRTQVQLKDKARNLKLFFLKSGNEVPYYLRCVTGGLKKRAPRMGSKNAAAKNIVGASAEEDAAHVAAATEQRNFHDGCNYDVATFGIIGSTGASRGTDGHEQENDYTQPDQSNSDSVTLQADSSAFSVPFSTSENGQVTE
jgi:hypothetical protein